MRHLQLGQGRDLHWSYHTHVPTASQYIGMVDGSECLSLIFSNLPADTKPETGGLFRLISRLMKSEATINGYLNLIIV
jgi:hypothetical protein